MNKKLFFPLVTLVGFSMFGVVNAAEKHTISAGYAQSNIKDSDVDDASGFNLKYRYEFNDDWGIIGSTTYTKKSYSVTGYGSGDVKYNSLLVGPTYRVNEYFSAYAALGIARGQDKYSERGYSHKIDETSAAYAAGFQINPIPNVAIDASYEYAKIDDTKIGTWMLGVGYRF